MKNSLFISSANLDGIVDAVMASYREIPDLTNFEGYDLPSKTLIESVTRQLEILLFPGFVECEDIHSVGLHYNIGKRVSDTFNILTREIEKSLRYACISGKHRGYMPECDLPLPERARNIGLLFYKQIPRIRELVFSDLKAAFKGDPAAKSYAEIILSYPGVHALSIYRLAHALHELHTPLIPRMMTEIVHRSTGIDIHPGATIGEGLFIDHGTGVVIGETSVIGNRVKIYQGVTLGALSIPTPEAEGKVIAKRHPTIEDDVTIYSGASILGGNTIVGARSVIGSNVWLTHSVEPDTKVLYVQPDLKIKPRGN